MEGNQYVPGDVLQTLKNCAGYYERPGNKAPLVGYAGTYEGKDGKALHYVGFKYFNCAKIEQYPKVRRALASEHRRLWHWQPPNVILGAPMGGILYADSLAEQFPFGTRVVFAEKKVTKLADVSGGRETSVLLLDRHELHEGERVVICEDICNNFSTTAQLVSLIRDQGAIPFAIACLINRSAKPHYQVGETIIPVSALADIPTEQFKQDDPAVADDVKNGNVSWKPKQRSTWEWLMKFMDKSA